MTCRILLIFTLAGSLLYYYYLYLSWRGYRKAPKAIISRKRSVSVVTAARNEEANIRELLLRLLNQNYDQDNLEIIIADDGSSDNTAGIVEQFCQSQKNVKLLRVERKKGRISSKKNALQQAVEQADGEIILITDADCLPGPNWVKSQVSCFDKETDMVAGLSRTRPSGRLKTGSVEWFEHFDFLAMFAVAGGLILQRKYFSCSAQNLAYRRKSWEAVGGYQPIMHLESGDDVNLMQLFRKAGFTIDFNQSAASFMYTRPISSWGALINQRSRWASNTSIQTGLNPEFFLYLMSVLTITFFPWLLMFCQWQIALLLVSSRLLLEMSFVRGAFRRFKANERLWLSYPLWLLIQPIYMIIVSLRGFFSFYEWKR